MITIIDFGTKGTVPDCPPGTVLPDSTIARGGLEEYNEGNGWYLYRIMEEEL
jgi:hypothetical protein